MMTVVSTKPFSHYWFYDCFIMAPPTTAQWFVSLVAVVSLVANVTAHVTGWSGEHPAVMTAGYMVSSALLFIGSLIVVRQDLRRRRQGFHRAG